MITDNSNFYIRFPSEIENRLDFVFNHVHFDYLKSIQASLITKHIAKMSGNAPDFSEFFTYFDSGVDFKGANYVDTGTIYYRAGDINDNNSLSENETTVRVPNDFVTTNSVFIEKEDILVVKDGATTGKIGYVPDEVKRGIFNTHIFKITCRKDKLNPKFLYYYLLSSIGQDQILKNISGSAQGGINLTGIASLFLIIPHNMKDLLKVVNKLETDVKELEKSAKTEQENLNELLLNELGLSIPKESGFFFKKGRNNFSEFYLSFVGDNQDRFHFLFHHPKQDILRKVEEKYKLLKMHEICKHPIQRGEQPKYVENGEIMIIKTVDMKNRYIDYENTLRTSQEFYESKPNAQIKKGDILISSTGYGSLGKVDLYDNDEPALADPQLLILRLKSGYNTKFIVYFLRSYLGQVQFDKWFSGSSGQIHFYPSDLEEFMIPDIDTGQQKSILDKIEEKEGIVRDLESRAELNHKESKELFERLILEP